jgi:hypothetical protein
MFYRFGLFAMISRVSSGSIIRRVMNGTHARQRNKKQKTTTKQCLPTEKKRANETDDSQ